MARSARGLPDGFALDLPEEKPVMIGDFLDEEPPAQPSRKASTFRAEPAQEADLRASITAERTPVVEPRPVQRPTTRPQPSVIRYQLNLTPKSKVMLEDFVKHVQTYSPQNDARTSEVFQGIMTLLHGAMNELELSDLPRRGAWGSVTAKNFPSALGAAFERSIVTAAKRRGRL